MEYINSLESLEALYGAASEMSLQKETDVITDEYRRLIEASPFFAFATSGPDGMDCSPRGDAAGFVHVLDDRTLAIPDRRGNNRLDSLRNIVNDPRVGLLFLIPGVGETLRVNGAARLTADPPLRQRFTVNGRTPNLVVVVTVASVYFQCSKATLRSKLWDPEGHVDRALLPSPGQIMETITCGDIDGAEADRAYPDLQLKTMY